MILQAIKYSKFLAGLFFLSTSIKADTSAPYNYELNGADWGLTFPDCGNGGYQSPIDLLLNSMMELECLQPLSLLLL